MGSEGRAEQNEAKSRETPGNMLALGCGCCWPGEADTHTHTMARAGKRCLALVGLRDACAEFFMLTS